MGTGPAPGGTSRIELGRAVVLRGPRGGKYPDGNSLFVRGGEERVLIDPSTHLADPATELPEVDRVLLSHVHEDHFAGCARLAALPLHAHAADQPALASLEDLLELYGYDEPIRTPWREALVERFHFRPRLDAVPFEDGAVFDLGGVRIHAIHAPGHTRGHTVFLMEPDGVLFLGDIDLSSFGPYYGDAWSSLVDFEETLRMVREIPARVWVTFHHVGVLHSRPAFLERLDRFEAVIRRRERRLLEYLAEPRTLDEIAQHRFVYRPGDAVPFAEAVERRSMAQHLERLEREGRVAQVEPGRFRAR